MHLVISGSFWHQREQEDICFAVEITILVGVLGYIASHSNTSYSR